MDAKALSISDLHDFFYAAASVWISALRPLAGSGFLTCNRYGVTALSFKRGVRVRPHGSEQKSGACGIRALRIENRLQQGGLVFEMARHGIEPAGIVLGLGDRRDQYAFELVESVA